MKGWSRPIIEVGLSEGVDSDAGTQWFFVIKVLDGMLKSLEFGCMQRYVFLVGEFCVLMNDPLTIEIIKI